MTDKHVIKYGAYINKQTGEIVCQQINCNYSIQVYDMAQNMSAIYINTSPNPQSQIEFFANNSTNTASTTYSNCNLGINENNFYLYNMNGGTIWNTDLLANVSTFYMPITIANDLTANNISITGGINALNSTGNIILEPQQIEFFNNSPGSNFNIGCAGGNFYIYNGGSATNVLEINYLNDNVNINNSLTVNTATISTTLTCNNVVPTTNVTGTLGTSDLYYNTLYVAHGYIDFIDSLAYMSAGASFYGPLNVLNPVTGDNVFTLTVNNGNQLNIASVNQTTPITIDAGSNNMNLPGSLNVSGTINPNNTIVSYTGATTGTVYLSAPFNGTSYKKVVFIFEDYQTNTATVSFTMPVTFSSTASEYPTYNPEGFEIYSYTDYIIVEGFDTSTQYNSIIIMEGW